MDPVSQSQVGTRTWFTTGTPQAQGTNRIEPGNQGRIQGGLFDLSK